MNNVDQEFPPSATTGKRLVSWGKDLESRCFRKTGYLVVRDIVKQLIGRSLYASKNVCLFRGRFGFNNKPNRCMCMWPLLQYKGKFYYRYYDWLV